MKWIARKNVEVDRVACPWLIKRFIDREADFIFVDEEKLLDCAKSMQAIPFDAPRIKEINLNHRGERCTFEAICSQLITLRSSGAFNPRNDR